MFQFKTTLRDPHAFFLRLAMGVVISMIVGLTWLRVDLEDATSQQNVPGCLFYLATFVSNRFTILKEAGVQHSVHIILKIIPD